MLVDSSYFIGKRFLANVNEIDINNKTSMDLDRFIETTEKQLLSSVFGKEMYLDFINKYESETLTPEYESLLNGTNYQFDGKTYFWAGLRNEDDKTSLIVDLIYYEYKSHTSTMTTELGESTLNLKAGETASGTFKMLDAFNSFSERCFGGFGGMADGYTLEGNPFWVTRNGGIDFYGLNRINENASLMQFLYDNKSDYPLLKPNISNIDFEFKNSFGI